MTVFVIIGAVGLALVVVSLIFGDVLDGVLDFAHFDVTDGWLSTPVLGAFLAAFGFAGALLLRGLQVSLLGATPATPAATGRRQTRTPPGTRPTPAWTASRQSHRSCLLYTSDAADE